MTETDRDIARDRLRWVYEDDHRGDHEAADTAPRPPRFVTTPGFVLPALGIAFALAALILAGLTAIDPGITTMDLE